MIHNSLLILSCIFVLGLVSWPFFPVWVPFACMVGFIVVGVYFFWWKL